MRKRAFILTAALALGLGAAAPSSAHVGHGSCADFGIEGTADIAQVSPGNLAALIQSVPPPDGAIADVVASEHATFCD